MGITMVDGTGLPAPSMTLGGAQLVFQVDTDVLANDAKIYTPPSTDTGNKMAICARTSVGYTDATSNKL